MKQVKVYTDGSCLTSRSQGWGPGGWAAILIYNGTEKEISGGSDYTTNNKMEITAALEALKILKEPCEVTIYSDSQYVCNSITKGWARCWKNGGWRKSDGKPAKNRELWEHMLQLCEIHHVDFVWVKGHNGDYYNERCDTLATSESVKRFNKKGAVKDGT